MSNLSVEFLHVLLLFRKYPTLDVWISIKWEL